MPAPPSANDMISIRGAREHNLRNMDVDIPRNQFVVVTGVSGSGKSTLAFDLLFAEGQRRFLDSMNTYARQYVEQMARPEVDLITGIPPTVSIEQRTSRGGGKSTVATITEVHHFLRLLFARLGVQFCPDCAIPVEPLTPGELLSTLRQEARKRGTLKLLAPVIRGRKGFHSEAAELALKRGYAQIRADGVLQKSSEKLRLDRYKEHWVEIVTGSVGCGARENDSEESVLLKDTLGLGKGVLQALDSKGTVSTHSTERTCPQCSISFPPLDPKMFSYNSPAGWCPTCRGFGETFYLPEVDRGSRAEAVEESWFDWMEGKRELCSECKGARLNRTARAVRLVTEDPKPGTKRQRCSFSLEELANVPVEQAFSQFERLQFTGRSAEVARDILPEIRSRLAFLTQVGLGYLQLSRAATTLSGGEAQRIRLAAQLGSNLTGVLYVLDEPTIGLHARDTARLLSILKMLRRRGNSLVVVEHDEETMRQADYVIDLGPGAGLRGGTVVASGPLAVLQQHPESVTGACLRAKRSYPSRGSRRAVSLGRSSRKAASQTWLSLETGVIHNLQNLKVKFPLGRLIGVSGVSGSGKSTLVRHCLLPSLQRELKARGELVGTTQARITGGAECIQSVHEVDQSPIGRTPRSTPATYVGFFDDIRRLFAQVPESRLRGYGPGRFSFNSPQGRCPACEGAGMVKLEMNFLPSAFVRCEACEGLRFNRETLEIRFHDRNIAEVMRLSVEEALTFFQSHSSIRRPLQALYDTGLDYLQLGQISPTLSGGEAQRVKLVTHLLSGLKAQARELGPQSGRNLFVLEEPTIGLHMSDVHRLIEVLQRLVEAGHTVIVIEHNLDLLAEMDWIIDLGPEAGGGGGRVVAQGTPEQVAQTSGSHTGSYLAKLLHHGPR